MGAWGAGPFQNDHALDFLAELSELPPAGMGSRITSALVLPSDGYLELHEACAAIAAAELIAAARSAAIEGPDERPVVVVQPDKETGDAEVRDLVLAALVRVNGAWSEWRDMWLNVGFWGEDDPVITGPRAELS